MRGKLLVHHTLCRLIGALKFRGGELALIKWTV